MSDMIIPKDSTTIAYSDNPALVYLKSLGANSARTMQQALETIAWVLSNGQASIDTFPWRELRIKHTQAVRSALVDRGLKHSTINRMLCALRGTLRTAWLMGQMTAEEYQQAITIRGVKGTTLPAGRSLGKGELAALMAVCEHDRTPAGARDAAMIAVLYSTGMRRAELAGLTMADYDPDKGSLKIIGKGNKERLAWLVGGARDALNDWLAIRGPGDGPIFLPIRKGGHVEDRRMTEQALYKMLQARAVEAGIQKLSPHDLRRTFVSDLLDRLTGFFPGKSP